MIDLLYEIQGSLLRNKMRTIATGIAVASGIFLLIVLQGAGNGILNSFEKNARGFAFDAIRVWGGWTSRAFEGMSEGRRIQLDNRDREMITNRLGQKINRVATMSEKYGMVVSHGSEYISNVNLSGIEPHYQHMLKLRMLRGRFLHQQDVNERKKVLLISDKREKEIAVSGRSLLNDYVLIGGQYFRVVGIYEDQQNSSTPRLYAPISTIQTLFGTGKDINGILIDAKPMKTDKENESLERELRTGLSHIHSFHPEDRQAVWIWNEAQNNKKLNTAKTILKTSLWILGLLTLVSGVVGVSNIMLIAVKERTREFGIRKALGATPGNIIRMIMLESVLITSIFGYVGILAGVGFCAYMDATVGNRTMDIGIDQMQYFVDPTVGLSTCLWAALVLVVAGALAGFFPAHKAAHVKPIEALHA